MSTIGRQKDKAESELAQKGEVVSSFDLGTSNFAYAIARRRREEAKQLLEKHAAQVAPEPSLLFAPVFEVLQWVRTELPGNRGMEYVRAMLMRLRTDPVFGKVETVKDYIEHQVGLENPIMLALSFALFMHLYERRYQKDPRLQNMPESVGATRRFSYFYLATPEGGKNRPYRKALSVAIVKYLIDQWAVHGWIKRDWVRLFDNNTAKQDDYADCLLQLYVAECEAADIRPSWEALEGLFAHLMKHKHFGEKGAWPLQLTADGQKRWEVRRRMLEREEKRAEQERAKKQAHQEKRKKKPASKKRKGAASAADDNSSVSGSQRSITEMLVAHDVDAEDDDFALLSPIRKRPAPPAAPKPAAVARPKAAPSPAIEFAANERAKTKSGERPRGTADEAGERHNWKARARLNPLMQREQAAYSRDLMERVTQSKEGPPLSEAEKAELLLMSATPEVDPEEYSDEETRAYARALAISVKDK